MRDGTFVDQDITLTDVIASFRVHTPKDKYSTQTFWYIEKHVKKQSEDGEKLLLGLL